MPASATTPPALAHHVVVIGAGFAGLQTVQSLRGSGARITLIDQRNHHLFQPLLYQVAGTVLSASEIAWPVRTLMERRADVTTFMARVSGIDPDGRMIHVEGGPGLSYDTLVIATGARHSYFGNDEWATHAPGLKTLEDATRIRHQLLLSFERAEQEPDPDRRRALLTFCVIGGGATGVELAGIFAGLAKADIWPEFRNIDTRTARVVLVEAGPRLLSGFSEDTSAYVASALGRLGVEIRRGAPVTACMAEGVRIGDDLLPSRTVVWAAGVAASPAAVWLGVPADKAGRVIVGPDLTVEGRPDIFVIGDTAAVKAPDGTPVPGIAPAAKQQGTHVARVIRARLAAQAPPGPFRYRHWGSLATVGRGVAVIEAGRFRLRGRLAWWVWGIAHIYFLIGTRSRLAVAWSWLWTQLRGEHSARLILNEQDEAFAPKGSRIAPAASGGDGPAET